MTPVSEKQEARMRAYFIQAAKEILRGEGLRGISVRNIAEQAGYSYATLYNYFKDLRDLIFECVRDFQEECESQIEHEIHDASEGAEKLRQTILTYCKYFVQYPGIFELFFLERMSDIRQKQSTQDLITGFLPRLMRPHWKSCVAQKLITEQEAENLSEKVNWQISGLLLFYLNRNNPADYNQFLVSVGKALPLE